MNAISGMQLGKELVEAMGIGFPICSIAIEAEVRGGAMVTLKFPMTSDQADGVVKAMGRYRLVAAVEAEFPPEADD